MKTNTTSFVYFIIGTSLGGKFEYSLKNNGNQLSFTGLVLSLFALHTDQLIWEGERENPMDLHTAFDALWNCKIYISHNVLVILHQNNFLFDWSEWRIERKKTDLNQWTMNKSSSEYFRFNFDLKRQIQNTLHRNHYYFIFADIFECWTSPCDMITFWES